MKPEEAVVETPIIIAGQSTVQKAQTYERCLKEAGGSGGGVERDSPLGWISLT